MMISIRDKISPVIPADELNQPCPPLVVNRYSQTATVVPSSFILGIATNMRNKLMFCYESLIIERTEIFFMHQDYWGIIWYSK